MKGKIFRFFLTLIILSIVFVTTFYFSKTGFLPVRVLQKDHLRLDEYMNDSLFVFNDSNSIDITLTLEAKLLKEGLEIEEGENINSTYFDNFLYNINIKVKKNKNNEYFYNIKKEVSKNSISTTDINYYYDGSNKTLYIEDIKLNTKSSIKYNIDMNFLDIFKDSLNEEVIREKIDFIFLTDNFDQKLEKIYKIKNLKTFSFNYNVNDVNYNFVLNPLNKMIIQYSCNSNRKYGEFLNHNIKVNGTNENVVVIPFENLSSYSS